MKVRDKVTSINKNKVERTYPLKIERLLNKDFADAMQKLLKIPMRPNASMKIKRGNLLIYQAAKEYIAKRQETFEKYCERDEKNEIVYEDVNKTMYKVSDAKQPECEKELNLLVEKAIDFPVINTGAFLGVDVTAEFLSILDGIIMEEPN